MEMYHKDDEVKTVIIIPEQMESRIEIKTNDMFFMEKLNRRCNSLPDDYVRYCHTVNECEELMSCQYFVSRKALRFLAGRIPKKGGKQKRSYFTPLANDAPCCEKNDTRIVCSIGLHVD